MIVCSAFYVKEFLEAFAEIIPTMLAWRSIYMTAFAAAYRIGPRRSFVVYTICQRCEGCMNQITGKQIMEDTSAVMRKRSQYRKIQMLAPDAWACVKEPKPEY
jgi:hypothetical protein